MNISLLKKNYSTFIQESDYPSFLMDVVSKDHYLIEIFIGRRLNFKNKSICWTMYLTIKLLLDSRTSHFLYSCSVQKSPNISSQICQCTIDAKHWLLAENPSGPWWFPTDQSFWLSASLESRVYTTVLCTLYIYGDELDSTTWIREWITEDQRIKCSAMNFMRHFNFPWSKNNGNEIRVHLVNEVTPKEFHFTMNSEKVGEYMGSPCPENLTFVIRQYFITDLHYLSSGWHDKRWHHQWSSSECHLQYCWWICLQYWRHVYSHLGCLCPSTAKLESLCALETKGHQSLYG